MRFENVIQSLGRTRTLDASLQVAGPFEQVEVSASIQALDQTSDTLGTDVERRQVQELSLNGRNWATLTALASGAVDTGGSNQRSIRFAGRGRDDNNFTYDGVDATNVINQAQQPYVRLAIPMEHNPRVSSRVGAGNGRNWSNGRRPTPHQLTFGDEPVSRCRLRIPAQQCVRRQGTN
jgi:hypothetical protein